LKREQLRTSLNKLNDFGKLFLPAPVLRKRPPAADHISTNSYGYTEEVTGCWLLDAWKDRLLDAWKDRLLDAWKDRLLNA
jgi:hypothetical protein